MSDYLSEAGSVNRLPKEVRIQADRWTAGGRYVGAVGVLTLGLRMLVVGYYGKYNLPIKAALAGGLYLGTEPFVILTGAAGYFTWKRVYNKEIQEVIAKSS